MKLIQRVGYYLGGFSVGLILLAFFLSGKKASCSYGLDARVLKNISTKQQLFSSRVQNDINNNVIDTTTISYILKKGDVNFSKSNTKLDSCKIYVIEGNYNEKDIALTIENCDSIATIKEVIIK
jgi:hypothetical protein